MKTTTRWARLAARVGTLAALALMVPGHAVCQTTVPAPAGQRLQACAGTIVGSLGLTGWDCRGDCTLALDEKNEEKAWSFSVEPRIEGIVQGGPADGILQAGDVIVAIDGLLITTKEGGERIANLPADADVAVRFRRGSWMGTATIRTKATCRTSWEGPVPPPPPPPPEPAAARVMSPRIRVAVPPGPDSVLAPPPAPAPFQGLAPWPGEALPRPRLGIGFTCSDCGTGTDSLAGGELWFFSGPPEVTAVDAGGAADRAGIQIGDRILAIDGAAITTEAGGRAFAAIRAGVAVRVTVAKRSGRELTVTIVPEQGRAVGGVATPAPAAAPERGAVPVPPQPPKVTGVVAPPAPPAAATAPAGLPLRYSGAMAGVQVEVRGEPVMVSEMRGERTIVINADGLWIRIRIPSAGGR